MGRESKHIKLQRQAELADVMKQGLSYQRCWQWYNDRWGKSERMFQKDRTEIYRQWKETFKKDLDNDLMDLINKLDADRALAREFGQLGPAIQAVKLEAQLKGLLTKKGEVNVENQQINNYNLNLNLENYSYEELRELLSDTEQD